MALHQPALGRTTEEPSPRPAHLVAVVAVIVIATWALGMQLTGPAYDIVPDPAGLSGLSF